MSVLIADSGATKTSWVLLSGDSRKEIHTRGLNPHLLSDNEIERILASELLSEVGSLSIDQVYFYGAGCKAKEQAQRIEAQLKAKFPESEIQITTDIEGAGLALFPKKTGILIISGTGSNAGLMSNGKLIDSMNAEAFPNGDFGSGSHIGSLILQDYKKGTLPSSIKDTLDKTPEFSAIKSVSKLLASNALKEVVTTTGSLEDSLSKKYVDDHARSSITLLANQLCSYFGASISQNHVKMIGTTAVYFEAVFREVFKTVGIRLSDIVQNPMEGLINYHTINS